MIAFKPLVVACITGLVALPTLAHAICDVPGAIPLVVQIEDTTPQEHVLCPEHLDALPLARFSTTTLWTRGQQEFEGVWLSTLLQGLGVSDGEVTLHAINDYIVTENIATFEEGGALVAFRRNGKIMSPRDKGPYWLVWNYDANPAFRSELIYSLSIWQLDRIIVSR